MNNLLNINIVKTEVATLPYILEFTNVNDSRSEKYAFENWDGVVEFIQDQGHWWLNNVDISPYTKAYYRGRLSAFYDAVDGWYCPSPLSGEWAGESIPELLGDLIRQAEATSDDEFEDIDPNEKSNAVLDAYIAGYDTYFVKHAPDLIEVEA
jgi:hypothetical protein